MNAKFLLVLMTMAFAVPVLAAGPKWEAAHVRELRFREGVPGEQVRQITDPKEVEEILVCFRRATEAAKTQGNRVWPKCLDFVGERPESGRWLYDSDAGEFTRLDPRVERIYRLSDSDRLRVNACFAKSG